MPLLFYGFGPIPTAKNKVREKEKERATKIDGLVIPQAIPKKATKTSRTVLYNRF